MKVIVIGAGPVGALAGLYAADRGWDVEVYELRGDLRDDRNVAPNFSKSINMALSERGITAMKHSGSGKLLDKVLPEALPMRARGVHGRDSNGNPTETFQPYDVKGRYIRSIDRGVLNRLLIERLAEFPNVKFFFEHKLNRVDYDKRKAWFEDKSEDSPDPTAKKEIDFDLLLGCDGAHSSARQHLMKFARINYAQSYIETLWCEFSLPPASDNAGRVLPSARDGFAADPDALHIWPGQDNATMFIALPNRNKSFTCTLFAPVEEFAPLQADPAKAVPFFQKHFAGVTELMGADQVEAQFRRGPHLPLISIKCSPFSYGSSGVILGDAAHAMVPFYGQGMNSGLEDVRVLFKHLDEHPITAEGRKRALAAYNKERIPDAHAINDLSLGNYWEMQTGVRDKIHLLRKHVEEFLSDKLPFTGFATQYSRVSFSNQRYSEVIKVVAQQKKILQNSILASTLLPIVGGATYLLWLQRQGRVDLLSTLKHFGGQFRQLIGR